MCNSRKDLQRNDKQNHGGESVLIAEKIYW